MQGQVYEGYFENGNFFTSGLTMKVPEHKKMFIMLIDEPQQECEETKHIKSWKKFLSDINDCNEPLGEKFDESMSNRMNIARGFEI